MSQVLVFGDSISHGFNDPKGGWVSMLREWMEGLDEYWTVYNLSISGERAPRILRRFRQEAERRLEEGKTFVIFAVGVNDSRLTNGRPDVPEDEFRSAVSELMSQAKEIGRAFFLGLTRVDEPRTTPVPWRRNAHYLNERIERYEGIIRDVAGDGFIEIPLPEGWEQMLDDGLHPTREGHKVIFRAVKRKLESFV